MITSTSPTSPTATSHDFEHDPVACARCKEPAASMAGALQAHWSLADTLSQPGQRHLPVVCPRCRDIARREAADTTTCPAWCTDCDGFDIEDGYFRHARKWRDGDVVLAEIAMGVAPSGEVEYLTAGVEGVEFEDIPDIVLLGQAMLEMATLVLDHDLVLFDRWAA